MECPKCGAEITKNTLVCPNCKKVLKIVCPTCRTINTKNICKKCGEILASRCSKCGKINLTRNKNCTKCGYPTAISAIKDESLTDEFALIKIEFPNSDLIKAKLGSNQLYTKFKTNLDNMIVKYLNSIGLRRQIVQGDIYIIRFNKSYTFNSSAQEAIKSLIELANLFVQLNVKLLNRTHSVLKFNVTIMKKNTDSDPVDISTGFKATMLHQGNDIAMKALDSVQIITDDDFYEFYHLDYNMEGLDSAIVNGNMRKFYEINIKDKIDVEKFIDEEAPEEDDLEEMPNFNQDVIEQQDKLAQENEDFYNDEQDLYNMELIDFEEVNSTFYSIENIKILDKVRETLKNVPYGITTIKGNDIYQPYTVKLLSTVHNLGIYQNIIPITCHDDMKYSPYSFFKDLICTVFEYCLSQKLVQYDDFSMFDNTHASELIKNLVSYIQGDMKDIYETRNQCFQTFLNLFNAIPETLIYIENFEKIDESSLFILGQFFEHFNDLKISYLISHTKDFSLHKDFHFLLSMPCYTEISIMPTHFNEIINDNIDFYKNVLNDYYFQRIAKYSKGSILFLDFAIQYLVEQDIYKIKDDALKCINKKTVIIPSKLENIIQRRLNLLRNKDCLKFLVMCVMLGARIDIKTAQSFGFEKFDDIVKTLSERGFLYLYNNCIYFSNYNIMKNAVLGAISKKETQQIAQELLDVAFLPDNGGCAKIYLYELLENHENVIFEWEKLANISLSMGDFPSYINCSSKILDCLDKYAQNWSAEDLETYKITLYDNISSNMLYYNPENTRNIAEKTLINLSKQNDMNKLIDFCTKMIQGSISHGEYLTALNLLHKILYAMDDASINPDMKNFNLHLLVMSLIHVRILFNIGEYNDCLTVGYNILNVLDKRRINNIDYVSLTKDEFSALLVECIGYIALANIIALKEDVREFLKIAATLFDFIPEEYKIFVDFQEFLHGNKVEISPDILGKNIFSDMIFHIIQAFNLYYYSPKEFAKEIYKTKIAAKYASATSFELLADTLIGYSYIKLNQYKKANAILNEVMRTSQTKGMNAVFHVASYVMSILEMNQGKYDSAYGVLNNSNVQMEKSPVSDYIFLLNKINMYKILMCQGAKEQAEICFDQAKYIVNKYGLNFNLNIDINELMRENQDTNKETISTNLENEEAEEIPQEEPEIIDP